MNPVFKTKTVEINGNSYTLTAPAAGAMIPLLKLIKTDAEAFQTGILQVVTGLHIDHIPFADFGQLSDEVMDFMG